jgi:hypothetical protein
MTQSLTPVQSPTKFNYAQLDSNNRVIGTQSSEAPFVTLPDDLVELAEGQLVEIGYIYEDGEFTAPPDEPIQPPATVAARKITSTAFFRRMGEKHGELLKMVDDLKAQGSYELAGKLSLLQTSEFIDLDDSELRAGLASTNIFSEQELDNILADGTEAEIPESLK